MKKSKERKVSEVDMLSNLPDPILHLILSCLPTTEEVIRTSILSTRWRHVWTLVPSIDIDYNRGWTSVTEFKKNSFEEFVSQVLANKSTDLDRVRLDCVFFYNIPTIWRWVDAVSRNVKILDLSFCTQGEYEDIELPHSLVTCGSLEVLRLYLLATRLRLPKLTGFVTLRVLELKSCNLFKDTLVNDFLKGCSSLEDLSLVDCVTYKLDHFCISCPKLKNLRIDNRKILDSEDWDYPVDGMGKRLQICCPKLVFLEFAGFMAFKFILERLDSLKKVVIHPLDTYEWADDNVCELFDGFAHVESLSLRICLIQQFINLQDLPESLPNLKTLELITTRDAFKMNVLIRILICSPNLESLRLTIQKDPLHTSIATEDDDLEFWEMMEYDCIFEGLKMVDMTGISFVPHHLGIIEFLLQSSPVLETMSITPNVNMTDEKLSFTIELLSFKRASPEAEIIIVQD